MRGLLLMLPIVVIAVAAALMCSPAAASTNHEQMQYIAAPVVEMPGDIQAVAQVVHDPGSCNGDQIACGFQPARKLIRGTAAGVRLIWPFRRLRAC